MFCYYTTPNIPKFTLPRKICLSWQAALLFKVVELAGGGSVTNWTTPSCFLQSWCLGIHSGFHFCFLAALNECNKLRDQKKLTGQFKSAVDTFVRCIHKKIKVHCWLRLFYNFHQKLRKKKYSSYMLWPVLTVIHSARRLGAGYIHLECGTY